MSIYFEDGTKSTKSYPKWLMEQKLGRELHPTKETIDHIDGDFTNNDFSNLRIVPMGKHAKEDSVYVKDVKVICLQCGDEFYRRARDLDRNARLGKAGPFCSKQCAGKYGASIQNGRKRLPAQKRVPRSKREYYRKQKSS
jgi:hypothetical protein